MIHQIFFLQLGKIGDYLGRYSGSSNWKCLKYLCYIMLLLTWLFLRLLLFPFLASGIWTSITKPMENLSDLHTRYFLTSTITLTFRLSFTFLVVVLFILHIIWFIMILGVGYSAIMKKDMKDTRSDEENEN